MESIESGRDRIPWRLRAAALVFVSLGAAGTTAMVSAWMRGEMRLDLSPLVIWLGVSLLKRSDGARFWGLVIAWPLAIGSLIALPILLASGNLPRLDVPGKFSLHIPRWVRG